MENKDTIIETKTIPTLLQTAREIVEYRLATSIDDKYISWQEEQLERINSFPDFGITRANWLCGIVGESIFYNLALYQNIPIRVSNGYEDKSGIDFFLKDYPLDVTTDPYSIGKKIKPNRYTTLFLPIYRGQKDILKKNDYGYNGEEYLYYFLGNNYSPNEKYLIDLCNVNLKIYNLIDEEINSYKKFSFFSNPNENNLSNLNTILEILTTSTPSHPSIVQVKDHPVPVLLT